MSVVQLRPREAVDESEQAVLAEMIADATCLPHVLATGIQPQDFSKETRVTICRAIFRVREGGDPVDLSTVIAELERGGDLRAVGGRAAVAGLREQSISPTNAPTHARMVVEASRRRRAEQAIHRAEMLTERDPQAAREAIAEAAELLTTPSSEPEPEPQEPRWPAPLADEALHGLAGDVVRSIAPTTEADPVALLLQFLVFFGSAVGRRPHFMIEDTRHGLNEYVVIVGSTSKARKGTSEKRIRSLFKRAMPEFTGRVKSGLSSGEGLIWAVRDPITKPDPKDPDRVVVDDPGEPDKRLLVVESEFATALRRIERDGSSLSPVLRDAWDGTPLDTLVSERSKAKARAEEHHVSIVAHITSDELTRYLSRTEMANGLGNRFVVVCVKRSQYLPFGAGDPTELNDLVLRLRQAIEWTQEVPPIDMDAGARRVWEATYGALSDGKPGLRGAMLARAEAHVRRLAALYAVLDLAPEVRRDHLLAALALWDYVEASVRYVFRGEALGDPDADEVLVELRRARDAGLTRAELRDRFGRHWSSERLGAAVGLLEERALVVRTQEAGRGRPATRYRASDSGFWEATDGYLERARRA